MRNRINELYKEVCVPNPESHFIIVDQAKGDTVEQYEENVSHRTIDHDIYVYFVT